MSKVYEEIITKNQKNTGQDIRYLVAYSLYKQQKKEFVEKHELEHDKSPDVKQLKQFQDSLLTTSSLDSLYARTDEYMVMYGDLVFKKKLEQFNKIHTQINSKNNFWSGVAQSIVGSFIFTLVFLIIWLMIISSKEGGLKELLRQWLELN